MAKNDPMKPDPRPATEPKPEPKAEPRPEPELRVSARQFTIARGMRWERCGGFLHWAGEKFGKNHLKSIREWEARWSEFCSTPING